MRAGARAVLPTVLLLAAACAAPPTSLGPPEEPEEWVRRLPEGVDLSFPTHLIVRVVDDATGEPIAGARIVTHFEYATPMPGIWEPGWSGTTDRDGWILLPVEDRGNWLYVDADGYGPVGQMAVSMEFRLRRGRDEAVEVRDFLGHPLPGAVVDYMLGCGHTPDVRLATTDERGRAVLRCIDPHEGFTWIRASGTAGYNDGYGALDNLDRRGGVLVLQTRPAPDAEGTVLHADGRPATGLAVGDPSMHRGPWTLVDDRGRFRLFGVERGEILEVRKPDGEEALARFRFFPGVPCTVRLPGPGWKEAEPELHLVEVRGTLPHEVAPAASLPLAAVRQADGFTAEPERMMAFEEFADGRIRLPPGRFTLVAGSVAGRFRPARTEVTVPAGEPVGISLTENPRWRPRLVGRGEDGEPLDPEPFPWEGDTWIRTATGSTKAEAAPDDPSAIFVPAEGSFVVEHFARPGSAKRVFTAPPRDDEAPLVLEGPEWGRTVPKPVGEALPEAEVRVLLPEGIDLPGCKVEVSRTLDDGTSDEESFRLDDAGTALVSLHRGDRIRVVPPTGEPRAPLEAVVRDRGPWTLRWPDAVVEVRIVDETGRPVDLADVLAWDWSFRPDEGGAVVLRGFAPGPVRLWVAADGHCSAEVRLVLREGERRRSVTVVLPEVP